MKKTMLLIGFCASVMTACGTLGLGGPTATATVDAEATAAVEAEQALSTQNAQATVDAIMATAEAEETSASETESAVTPTIFPAYTTLTARADESIDLVQSLYDGEFISTVDGKFLPVSSYHDSIAKINYIAWDFTGYSPKDFVFQSDISWQSASDISNWFNAACGMVFRVSNRGENFYAVFIHLDGNIKLEAYDNGLWRTLATKNYGRLEIPDGGAELLVTAEGERVQVFVNSKLIIDAEDGQYAEGEVGFILISGTNKGFGTRCNFDDVTLWELDSTD